MMMSASDVDRIAERTRIITEVRAAVAGLCAHMPLGGRAVDIHDALRHRHQDLEWELARLLMEVEVDQLSDVEFEQLMSLDSDQLMLALARRIEPKILDLIDRMRP